MRHTPGRIALTLLTWAAAAPAPIVAQQFPTDQWPTARPADVGVGVAALDSIDAEIREGRYGYVDRIVVIRSGRLVWDRRYEHDYVEA